MMQEDRSQHRNRAKAMAVLRTRLYDFERQKLDAARAAERRGQVGTGDRSERIRTYNYPQGRVSDHRINLTLYKLPQIMEGEALGEIIDALVAENQAAQLAAEETQLMTSAADAVHAGIGGRREGAHRCRCAACSGRRDFRAAGIDSPELDARHLDRPRAFARSRRPAASDRARSTRHRRDERDRGLGRGAASRMSRSRALSASRNSGASISLSTPRRWCRGRRPKRSSKPLSPRSTTADRARAPLRIADLGTGSRRDPAGALDRIAERLRRRQPMLSLPARLPSHATMRGSLGLEPRRIRRLRYGGGVARAFRPDRFQSALYRIGGYRSACPRGAIVRSAPARSMAEPTALTSIARLPPRRPLY